MAHELTSRFDDVNAVLVSTLPGHATAVEEYADHAGRTSHIAGTAQFIAHVLEAVGGDRLAEETFLEHAEPEVSTVILDDGIDLALGEIYLLTEEGIIGEGVLTGVVDGDTLTVVAYDDAVLAGAIERRNLFQACRRHVDEVASLLTVEARIGGYKDVAVAIGAELSENEVLPVLEVVLQPLTVVTDEALLV